MLAVFAGAGRYWGEHDLSDFGPRLGREHGGEFSVRLADHRDGGKAATVPPGAVYGGRGGDDADAWGGLDGVEEGAMYRREESIRMMIEKTEKSFQFVVFR